MTKNNHNLDSLIRSINSNHGKAREAPSYRTSEAFEPSQYEMRDILIGKEAVKYRKGEQAKWQHADPAQLLDPESAGLPEDLIEEVEGNLGRFNLVEDGAPVHVFLDSMYQGTLLRNLRDGHGGTAQAYADSENNQVEGDNTQVDAVADPNRRLNRLDM